MPKRLEMKDITKSFPGVQALAGVDLELAGGEVLALLGENGAGKSTLIRVLAGVHPADGGSIRIDGATPDLANPARARAAGIAVIHQEFPLVPHLSVAANLFLGRERVRGITIDRAGEERQAQELFARLGVALDPRAPCHTLSIAQRQVVEIAKALVTDARLVVMDEPTATLTPREVDALFGVIRELRGQGIGILYISHRLEEVFAIADRVTVLRDGSHVASAAIGDIDRQQLIEWMVGRSIDQEFPKRTRQTGAVRLRVRGLTREPAVRDISFDARGGEILAITGLVGAGRTELARLLAGADPRDSGAIQLDGQPLDVRNPRAAIDSGIGLLTEDRGGQGLVLHHSLTENFGLPNLDHFVSGHVLHPKRERVAFHDFVNRLRIKITAPGQAAETLSGGNQQKVVLAKWLEQGCEVVLIDEPTRGIDVGARYDFYTLLLELAGQGKVVIFISSELPEVLGMADRILVMRDGRLAGEIADVAAATPEQIMELAIQ